MHSITVESSWTVVGSPCNESFILRRVRFGLVCCLWSFCDGRRRVGYVASSVAGSGGTVVSVCLGLLCLIRSIYLVLMPVGLLCLQRLVLLQL